MSIYEEEIAGGEFDWFAIDLDGNIAIFSTAGEGGVPNDVINNYKSHNLIAESFESPNWGSPEVWSDYAKLGLFVYDWELPGGPYLLERKPAKGMSFELRAKITAIACLPKLPIHFTNVKEINNVPKNM